MNQTLTLYVILSIKYLVYIKYFGVNILSPFSLACSQIFCEDVEDYELGELLRGEITDNPLDIYLRVSARGGAAFFFRANHPSATHGAITITVVFFAKQSINSCIYVQ